MKDHLPKEIFAFISDSLKFNKQFLSTLRTRYYDSLEEYKSLCFLNLKFTNCWKEE